MEVVTGVVIFANTATIPLAQKVAAELSCSGDISDVRIDSGGERGREGFTRGLWSKGKRMEKY